MRWLESWHDGLNQGPNGLVMVRIELHTGGSSNPGKQAGQRLQQGLDEVDAQVVASPRQPGTHEAQRCAHCAEKFWN